MIQDLPRHLVGLAVLIMAFGIVAGLFLLAIPEGNREVAFTVLGVAIGWTHNVVTYYYGTSQGSSSKQKALEGQLNGGKP